jgi:carboxypeptidase family protein
MRSTLRFALRAGSLAYSSNAAAQTIGGQVVDLSGRPLVHVRLLLVDSTRATVDTTIADSAGTFYLTAHGPSTYVVRLDAPGLSPVLSAPIRLTSDAFEQSLYESALCALATYRFVPGEANDQPVAALVRLPFLFRLPSLQWPGNLGCEYCAFTSYSARSQLRQFANVARSLI